MTNSNTNTNMEAEGDKFSLRNRRSGLDFDFISDLPVDICNAILVRLPIADAVKTSVLSRKWRYRWASIPYLVFGKDWILPGDHEDGENDHKVVDIVNGVLLVHKGPVHKFVCSGHYVPPDRIRYQMDQWMLFLSKHGIKQLILGPFMHGDNFIVHSCLFSCQELTDLELVTCEIKLPLAFEGFRSLRNLTLIDIHITDDELERLISKCPLLETLILETVDGMIRFKINAPNLHYLCFNNEMESHAYNEEHLKQGGVCKVIKLLGSLHHIEKLTLDYHSLQFLSFRNIPDELPTSFLHLNNLSMFVSFMDSKEVFTILYMLRSSLDLKKLELHILNRNEEPYSAPPAVFWEAQEHLGCLLNHLQTVKMTGIMGEEWDLCFIRYVLANAPVLEMMRIDVGKEIAMVKKLMFLQDMLQFRRASAQAIIRCNWESI